MPIPSSRTIPRRSSPLPLRNVILGLGFIFGVILLTLAFSMKSSAPQEEELPEAPVFSRIPPAAVPPPSNKLQALTSLEVSPPPEPQEILPSASFTDLLSGTGWIDITRTTLVHDSLHTAFVYPADVSVSPLEIVSTNIALGYTAEIREARFSPSGTFDGVPATFYLSTNNGETWHTVLPDKYFVFPSPAGRGLWWRASVPGGLSSKSFSLDDVRVYFKMRILEK